MLALHRILVSFFVGLALVLTGPLADAAEKKSKSPSLIRDAEIEGFLRQLARPLFKAAGLNPKIVRVHVIAVNRSGRPWALPRSSKRQRRCPRTAHLIDESPSR